MRSAGPPGAPVDDLMARTALRRDCCLLEWASWPWGEQQRERFTRQPDSLQLCEQEGSLDQPFNSFNLGEFCRTFRRHGTVKEQLVLLFASALPCCGSISVVAGEGVVAGSRLCQRLLEPREQRMGPRSTQPCNGEPANSPAHTEPIKSSGTRSQSSIFIPDNLRTAGVRMVLGPVRRILRMRRRRWLRGVAPSAAIIGISRSFCIGNLTRAERFPAKQQECARSYGFVGSTHNRATGSFTAAACERESSFPMGVEVRKY